MGADMLLVGLPAAEVNQDRQRQLEQIINGLADADLAGDELQNLADDPEGIRKVLGHHVERYANASGSRDVVRLHLPHMPYAMFFTGGPSWGDDPTLMFETFAVLAEVEPLFAQLEQWAIEDAESDLPTHQEPSALAVLREFVGDVQSAYGTGRGHAIDEHRLDWPDLAVTYHRALEVLGRPAPCDFTEEEPK